MGTLKKAAAVTGLLTAAGVGEILYFYNMTMKRGNLKTDKTMKMSGTDWSQYAFMMEENTRFAKSQQHKDVYIKSYDGLKLHAVYFPPIIQNTGENKIAICFHGYTGECSNYFPMAKYFLERGYALLMPDARAHGESEGQYVGFGCLDRHDARNWIDWAIEECGDDVKIMLHGTSMGGATVLMASGLKLPANVKGIVSDCGFTSPKEVFTHVLNNMYHLPAFPAIPGADILNKRLAGYGMDECNAKHEVRKTTVPILFIHGSNDTFVPFWMCGELYDCCASPKKKLVVEGAAHGESYYKDTAAYEKAMTDFADEIFK